MKDLSLKIPGISEYALLICRAFFARLDLQLRFRYAGAFCA